MMTRRAWFPSSDLAGVATAMITHKGRARAPIRPSPAHHPRHSRGLCRPPGSSPPRDADRTGLPMLIATADGQYADLPTGGHSAAVAIVTDGDNLHRVAPVCPATDRLIH